MWSGLSWAIGLLRDVLDGVPWWYLAGRQAGLEGLRYLLLRWEGLEG